MTLNYVIIGRNIKLARNKKELSQADLAEIADMSTGHISMIETGARGFSMETFVGIANLLGVSADELLGENLLSYRDSAQNSEFDELIQNCNAYERRVILDIAKETKRILRENRYMKPKP